MASFFLEQSNTIPELIPFILQELLKIFDLALKQNKSESYWDLLCFYIHECNVTPNLEEKYLSFIKVLENYSAEQSSKESDPILSGILKVIKTVIEKISLEISENTVNLILHNCLFEIPSIEHKNAPKCKNSSTRKEAFDLLKKLCSQSNKALLQAINYLSSQYQDPH